VKRGLARLERALLAGLMSLVARILDRRLRSHRRRSGL
jgi:hypothetical protein